VIATCRDLASATALNALVTEYGSKRLLVGALDTEKKASYDALLSQLSQEGIKSLDIVIANAGAATQSTALTATAEEMVRDYNTNVVGTLLTIQAFNDLVVAGGSGSPKLLVVISSICGSVESSVLFGSAAAPYRASKAAVNMLCRTYSEEPSLKEQGGKVLALHPGMCYGRR
jgi:norsolorinic acid ketoreductase